MIVGTEQVAGRRPAIRVALHDIQSIEVKTVRKLDGEVRKILTIERPFEVVQIVLSVDKAEEEGRLSLVEQKEEEQDDAEV